MAKDDILKEVEVKKEQALRSILEKEFVDKEEQLTTVGEHIDPEKHIWFTQDSQTPIINEDGINILADVSGAEFSDPVIIEKQSDFKKPGNAQVWIEVEVSFPSGETNKDYGIANNLNCPSGISKANMPIMALKRARERALLRSKTIDLKAFSDNEMRNTLVNELREARSQIADLNRERNHLLKENESTRKRMNNIFVYARESVFIDGRKVWDQTDQDWLNDQLKKDLKPIEEYIVKGKLRWLQRNQENK